MQLKLKVLFLTFIALEVGDNIVDPSSVVVGIHDIIIYELIEA